MYENQLDDFGQITRRLGVLVCLRHECQLSDFGTVPLSQPNSPPRVVVDKIGKGRNIRYVLHLESYKTIIKMG